MSRLRKVADAVGMDAADVVITSGEWSAGLTSMRRIMHAKADARVVLGGRVDGYKGTMPGIAEECLMSLKSGQPAFLLGGFGGCARDISETLGLVDCWASSLTGLAVPPAVQTICSKQSTE